VILLLRDFGSRVILSPRDNRKKKSSPKETTTKASNLNIKENKNMQNMQNIRRRNCFCKDSENRRNWFILTLRFGYKPSSGVVH
jgi:hypothetical protein